MKKLWLALLIVAILLAAGVALAFVAGTEIVAPAAAALHFPWSMLSAEASTMNDCVECHEPEQFHTCASCHDDHGSAELASVPFDDLILLAGDVPEPGYIATNDILPYRDRPGTHVALLDFLAEQGITDWETVTLASRDEGFVTLNRANTTAAALLMPHTDGVRFAAEDLHVSTWLKGVWRIIVVGGETPLVVDGQPTSMGRLLLGPTRSVTIEETNVMLSDEEGQVRKAKTAGRIEGAPVEELAGGLPFQALVIRDAAGEEQRLTAQDARGALLAQMFGRVTLVLPERSRASWIDDVVELRFER